MKPYRRTEDGTEWTQIVLYGFTSTNTRIAHSCYYGIPSCTYHKMYSHYQVSFSQMICLRPCLHPLAIMPSPEMGVHIGTGLWPMGRMGGVFMSVQDAISTPELHPPHPGSGGNCPKAEWMEKDFGGGAGTMTIYCLIVLHILYLSLPLLSFWVWIWGARQDLALEGKVLYFSRCMTLDKLHHSLQLHGVRTREPYCSKKEQTASSQSHKSYCASCSPGVYGKHSWRPFRPAELNLYTGT